MSWPSVVCISIGAALGALSRSALSNWLNGQRLPWGTLLANLIGGYLIGAAMAFLVRWPNTSPEVRLGAITGFLGALTTFSTFSAEVVTLFMSRDYRWGMALVLMHVVGSLVATLFGMWSVRVCF